MLGLKVYIGHANQRHTKRQEMRQRLRSFHKRNTGVFLFSPFQSRPGLKPTMTHALALKPLDTLKTFEIPENLETFEMPDIQNNKENVNVETFTLIDTTNETQTPILSLPISSASTLNEPLAEVKFTPAKLTEDIWVFPCPHCNISIAVGKFDINCGIFRCGIHISNSEPINPHTPQQECERLVSCGLIRGCGKPFKFDGTHAVICEYI